MSRSASDPARPEDRAGRPAARLPDYDEAVLDAVDSVPPGRAVTYGDVARALREAGWGGGPRTVGAVMARHGSAVAWWRVVRADGSLPVCDPAGARRRHAAEGTPMRGDRVELRAARVEPVARPVDAEPPDRAGRPCPGPVVPFRT